MTRRSSFASLTLAAVAATPALVAADPAIAYYTPPTLVKHGTNTTPAAGPGTVVIQVLVNKDGTFKVVRVIRSTNHGDDAAAREIAGSSTYKPASRGAAKLAAFYDYALKFTGKGSTASSDAGSGAPGSVAGFEGLMRAGNYAGAASGLTNYVAQHPGDTNAQQLLGVADTFLDKYDDAAAAFDKGGTVGSNYKATAAKAYAGYAAGAMKAHDSEHAVAAAQKAAALDPTLYTYNSLGLAELDAQQNDAAAAALEKARSLGSSAKASDRAAVDANLVAVYLAQGKPDAAKPIVAEAAQLDPSNTAVQTVFTNYYMKSAQAAGAAGKSAAAAALYEQGAAAAPSQAVLFYTQAAEAYLAVQPNPDTASAKADADKALALKPDDPAANYVAGIALADQPGKSKDALVYLNKADGLAKTANDSKLTEQIEAAIKQLGGTSK